MTPDTHEPDVRETLSALIDREPVDPDTLASCLDEPDHRALLVDFVRLRALLQEDQDDHLLSRPSAVTKPVPTGRTGYVRLAIAALLFCGVATAFWLGTRVGLGPDHVPAPTPMRSVAFTPGVDWR